MKIHFMILCAILLATQSAYSAVTVNHYQLGGGGGADVADTGYDPQKAETIATLKNDITILDSELAKCKKQKTGWAVATGIGSAGVLATGISAIVQGSKIKEQKNELSTKQQELKDARQELKDLQNTNK